jgi:hypothetical protein
MAQTTTAISACDVGIWLDDDAGTQQDISGSSNEVDMAFEQNIGEFVTFGSRWPVRQECGKDASFTVQIVYSSAADEAFDILKTWFFSNTPGQRTLSVYIPDKNVGSDHFTCEVRIASFNFTPSRGEAGPIIVSAELLPDGEVTHTTAST